MATKRIALLSTGGTIAGHSAGLLATDNIPHPDLAVTVASDLSHYIERVWGDRIELHQTEIADIDSSNVQPSLWTDLVRSIVDNYDEHDGFVVTHGTNTLAYTAAALSFAVANSSKPIVITGSQIPWFRPGSDARANVENAIRIAAYPENRFSGVLVVFGSHVITGARAKKSTEFDIDAFESFGSTSIARIGRILDIDPIGLEVHNSYLRSPSFNPARTASDLVVHPSFLMRGILSLTEFPGLDPAPLQALLDGPSTVQGVVFRAFGAGDASSHLLPFFEALREREIPMVVTTQAARGKATLQANEPGSNLRRTNLAIAAHDMSIESMTVKLGWLIAQDLSYREVCSTMVQDLRGEIRPAMEQSW